MERASIGDSRRKERAGGFISVETVNYVYTVLYKHIETGPVADLERPDGADD